ncbi:UNVERIFIED_CONTAM: hypothetical protein Scaly_1624500 [Sesamum calycinum]|uniref:Reverse transcriptase domain-containing protein n=1 Tax=Sesamum calycinum TaxID=2727403 RepID=A0AAW2PBQ7_9LAMI
MALKLNISKAYDKVEWAFLEQVLLKLGFHYRAVELIIVVSLWIVYGRGYRVGMNEHGHKPGRRFLSRLSFKLSQHTLWGYSDYRWRLQMKSRLWWRDFGGTIKIRRKFIGSLWENLFHRKLDGGPPLEASLGSQSSFTWRSIFSAKPVILANSRYRVWAGNSVKIWGDLWLPRPTTFKPITPLPEGLEHVSMATLIDPETNQWDEEKNRIDNVVEK